MMGNVLRAERFMAVQPERTDFSDIQILSEKKIGNGIYGEIFLVHARVAGVVSDQECDSVEQKSLTKNKTLTRQFVIKKFKHEQGHDLYATEMAKHSMAVYKALRETRLKVFPTMRLSSDKKSILMTLGGSADVDCIGTNDGTDRLPPEKRLRLLKEQALVGESIRSSITSVDEVHIDDRSIGLIDSVLKEAKKAGLAIIYIPSDAYFFLIPEKTSSPLDFVVADLDRVVDYRRKDEFRNHIVNDNLQQAKTALVRFFKKNTTYADSSEYSFQLLDDVINQKINNLKK